MRNWFYEQMAMYSAYHKDKRNQATHHVGVPMIVFSLLLALTPVVLVSLPTGQNITLAMLVMGALLLVYLYCVPLIGLVAVVVYGLLTLAANSLAASYADYLWPLFGVFFVGGWIIQLVGHVFEGRKPALMDNLLQIFMAPAFLIAEVFFLLNIAKAFQADIQGRMPAYEKKT